MACRITIDSVVGVIPASGTSPTLITVTGTATDCGPITTGPRSVVAVTVGLSCSGAGASAIAVVDATGNWTVEFGKLGPLGCTCGGPVTVDAACATDPTCAAHFTGVLHCQQPCPTVSVVARVGGCDATGRRIVTFDVTVTPPPLAPPPFITEVHFGDGPTDGAGAESAPPTPRVIPTRPPALGPRLYT